MLKQYRLRDYRFRLVFYVVALTIIGIMVVGSAKPSVQNKQIAGLILGLIVMVGISLIDYNFILKFSWIFYFVNVALLAAIFVIGEETKGARRWLKLGIRFQPSELGKILLVLFFAYYLSKNKDKLNNIRTLFCTLVLAAVPLLLIFKEPDLSTTIVTALIFASLLFIAGLSYKIVMGVLAVAVPSLVVVLTLVLQPGQKLLTGNQALRILGWLEPDKYPNIAYQQQNSIMAVGSGQLWGKGLNNTNIVSVKNGNFISEPQTDFIFSIVGEEMGFIGSVIIIVLLFLITIECLLVARRAKDMAGRLIASGIAALIGFQSFVNICVVTGLMPNTGLPLPFVSYGLTSLVTLFAGIGLVMNVGLQPRKYGQGTKRMNIGLIAHDAKKKLMQNFCIAYRGILCKNELFATGTTGRLIEEVANLNVHKYLAGHLGGAQQLGAQIEHNEIDLVIFLRDPLSQKSHEPDVNSVVRLCDIHNIPLATNLATAELLIKSLDRGDLEWREMYK